MSNSKFPAISICVCAAVALTTSGCVSEDSSEPADSTHSDGEPGREDPGESDQALIGSTANAKTGLVIKTSTGCTGVLIPTGSTTKWALTAQHCVDQEDYPPLTTGLHIELQNTTDVDVVHAYTHPQAEWGISNAASVSGDGGGKVDVVLLELANPVSIAVADRNFYFSTANTSVEVYHESRYRNGGDQFSWLAATITPDATYANHTVSNGATEPGDSGSPIWKKASIDEGGRLLEGIHRATDGQATDSSSFYEWVVDGIECGVFNVNEPSTTFCSTACPCGPGEGDCDSNAECQSGLTCQNALGDRSGLPSNYDVCLETSRVVSSTSGYCESIGGCQIYEGDCNSHAGCKGDLVCRPNVGAAIGLASYVDVCDLPRQHGWKGTNLDKNLNKVQETANYCTVDSPCALGDGDCDENNDATCRGYLRCKANVGLDYGFASNTVDVCVHPSYY